MKKLFLIIVLLNYFLILFAESEKIFAPFPDGNGIQIIEGPKTIHFNSLKARSFHYVVFNETIRNIRKYYINILKQSGYIKEEETMQVKNRKNYYYLRFISDEQIAQIWLTADNKSAIEVKVTQMHNNIIFDNSDFNIQNKEDNKGFDLKDIPRTGDSVRVVSMINSDDNDMDTCNIIYKSKLSRTRLADFYMRDMKKNKWMAAYDKSFYKNENGCWMTFHKENKNCLISIMYLDKFSSNIVSIYYSYK